MDTLSSRKNPWILHMRKLGMDRAYRQERREFLCDGKKLLQEAAASKADIQIVLTAEAEVPQVPAKYIFHVPQGLIDWVSTLKTPQKVVFSCAMPQQQDAQLQRGRYILLEDIQDPGNVGTVLRTADAFAVDGVLLYGNCADPYNEKTVRASMGAIFRMPFFQGGEELLEQIRALDLPLYGAALHQDALDIRTVDLSACVVAVGNEGRGLSPELLAACQNAVVIPMAERCESLNAAVAASIVMWEMYRR